MGYKQELDELGVGIFIDQHHIELDDQWRDNTIAYWGDYMGRVWFSQLTGKWVYVIETREIPRSGTSITTIIEMFDGNDTKSDAIRKGNEWYVENVIGRKGSTVAQGHSTDRPPEVGEQTDT